MNEREPIGVVDDDLDDDDVREFTEEEWSRAVWVRDFSSIEAALEEAVLRGRGVDVSMRFDPSILDHFKAQGPDWEARINAALRKAAGL